MLDGMLEAVLKRAFKRMLDKNVRGNDGWDV